MNQDTELADMMMLALEANEQVDSRHVWVTVQKSARINNTYFLIGKKGCDEPSLPDSNLTLDELVQTMKDFIEPRFVKAPDHSQYAMINTTLYTLEKKESSKFIVNAVFLHEDGVMVRDENNVVYKYDECYVLEV